MARDASRWVGNEPISLWLASRSLGSPAEKPTWGPFTDPVAGPLAFWRPTSRPFPRLLPDAIGAAADAEAARAQQRHDRAAWSRQDAASSSFRQLVELDPLSEGQDFVGIGDVGDVQPSVLIFAETNCSVHPRFGCTERSK